MLSAFMDDLMQSPPGDSFGISMNHATTFRKQIGSAMGRGIASPPAPPTQMRSTTLVFRDNEFRRGQRSCQRGIADPRRGHIVRERVGCEAFRGERDKVLGEPIAIGRRATHDSSNVSARFCVFVILILLSQMQRRRAARGKTGLRVRVAPTR